MMALKTVTEPHFADGVCWLAQFSDTPCEGRLVRCHVVPRQHLVREWRTIRPHWDGSLPDLIADRRTWVPGCGGLTGVGGHHGELDFSRKLRIPLHRLPPESLMLLEQIGLDWFLEREYA
jgi:hypothetical protein